MDSTKNEENAVLDFGHDQMMLKDTTIVEVDMEEPEKAKARAARVEVLHIHLHQCKAAYHLLNWKLQKVQTYICLIQEPWSFKGQLRAINSVNSS